jgi:hypothetical protein
MKTENDIRELIEEYKHSIEDYQVMIMNTECLSNKSLQALNNLIAIEQAHIDAWEMVLKDE